MAHFPYDDGFLGFFSTSSRKATRAALYVREADEMYPSSFTGSVMVFVRLASPYSTPITTTNASTRNFRRLKSFTFSPIFEARDFCHDILETGRPMDGERERNISEPSKMKSM
jgi:hypothetical protein